jgi:hypothetical protein
MKIVKYSVDDIQVLTDEEFIGALKSWNDKEPAYIRRSETYLPVPHRFPAGTPQGWDRYVSIWFNTKSGEIIGYDAQASLYGLDPSGNWRGPLPEPPSGSSKSFDIVTAKDSDTWVPIDTAITDGLLKGAHSWFLRNKMNVV